MHSKCTPVTCPLTLMMIFVVVRWHNQVPLPEDIIARELSQPANLVGPTPSLTNLRLGSHIKNVAKHVVTDLTYADNDLLLLLAR